MTHQELAKKIRKAVLEKYANEFCHHFDYKLWVCDIKSDFKMQWFINIFAHAASSNLNLSNGT